MIIIFRFLLAIFILLTVIYASSPLFWQYFESKINKIEGRVPYKVSKDALDFHSTLFVTDLHGDPLFSYRNLLRHNSTGHMDIPRLIEGNISLQVFGVPTQIPLFANLERNQSRIGLAGFLAFALHWPLKTWYSGKNRALYLAEKLHELEAKSEGTLSIIKTSGQLEEYSQRSITETHRTAGLLMLEGAHVIKRIPEDLEELYHRGFRIIGLTHLTDNHLGGSAHGIEKGGLTELGRKAVQRMEELHMIIDLTHASSELMDDVLAMTSRPVLVSHTGVKGCVDNSRNLSDEQLKAVASKGGLIGIGFWEEAVGLQGVESIADSIQYASQLVGVKHIALGSDFDGGVTIPFDASDMVHITDALIKQGFSQEEIRMIMGGNALNFLMNGLPENVLPRRKIPNDEMIHPE